MVSSQEQHSLVIHHLSGSPLHTLLPHKHLLSGIVSKSSVF